MESWFWMSLWIILFTNVSASPPYYTIHRGRVTFDQATDGCSPGVLTTLSTQQEVDRILSLVSESEPVLDQTELIFWVGLRKVKNECVVPTLPLRGFHWTEDGSEDSQVSLWIEEPKQTCTTVRCAALKVALDQGIVTRWGLFSVPCKHTYQFICKLKDTPKPATPKPPTPELVTPEPPTPEPPTPALVTPEPKHTTQETHKAESKPATPEPAIPESEPQTQKPEPDPKVEPESTSCLYPSSTVARFFTPDPENTSTRMLLNCWSGVQVKLHCSGRPAVWRVPDESPANFTAICQLCDVGFQKDESGNCDDIDECSSGAACRHTCLNTRGSHRCVCFDDNGKHHDDDSPVCAVTPVSDDDGLLSGIVIPVAVAVAALVVLVVVIAVTVKCCLRKRSKKRAMKKAEKMAMKSKDDNDSLANEKLAV